MRILLTVFLSATVCWAKSSEIPDRREFPINESVNPCTNFYEYACSKVNESFQLREDRSAHCFAFNDSAERLLEAKKKYFAGLAGLETHSEREAALKTNYLACMNETSRKAEEEELVKDTLAKMKAIHSRQEFLTLLAKNRLEGNDSPLTFTVENNQDRPAYLDLILETTWKTLPERAYYERPAVLAEFNRVLIRFFKDIGEVRAAATKAKKVIDYEKGLAKVYPTPVERRDLQSSRTGITREELLKRFPSFQLGEMMKQVPPSTHIRNMIPKAMEYLNTQLTKLPLDDLKSFYLYYTLKNHLDDAYPDYFQERFAFENRNFGGPEIRPVRAERCTREVMWRFVPELDSILWPKLFPDFPRAKVVTLAETIRSSILSSLEDNQWLSPEAKKEAIAKIKTAALYLVAPQDDEEWDFRPPATYDPAKPIANAKLFSLKMTQKNLKELQGPISARRWGMGPLTVNAYYDEAFNKFVLPVGILQYPFYDPKGPSEPNLAAIGTVIGHELGHSIDDKGSLYDSKGLLRTWMTTADLAEFKRRTQILVEQFGHAGMNGTLTLGENIGDLVGLTASHRAAFGLKYDKSKKSEERAFFVGYARAWCEVQRPKYAEMRILQNPHSLSVARVNEQVRQQPAFREAFQCKDTDAMVLPADKLVHLW